MWDLTEMNTDKPLYIALADALERDILSGHLKPGDRLPTHRELSVKVGVTVTTVSRAYAIAAEKRLIRAVVGRGTFVSDTIGQTSYSLDNDVEKILPIEMGFIHPLYTVEPTIGPLLQELSQSEELGALMQYASPKGLTKHCEIGAEWIRGFGVPTSPDQVFVMAGSQHALNCIFSSVFSPNEPIAVDCLTYPGIKSTAKLHHLKLEPVMMDEEGMVPESLSSLCERQSIRGVFAVGGIQNPTNYSMSQRRREELCAVMEQQDLILVEDDMYQFLSAVPNQALSRLIQNRSIYLSSLSRAFFNGRNTRWCCAVWSMN